MDAIVSFVESFDFYKLAKWISGVEGFWLALIVITAIFSIAIATIIRVTGRLKKVNAGSGPETAVCRYKPRDKLSRMKDVVYILAQVGKFVITLLTTGLLSQVATSLGRQDIKHEAASTVTSSAPEASFSLVQRPPHDRRA